mmetsp:Transcript_40681/g.79649  ORF Transcript_40681/g.79649 Transcript_40681/m.79649 type:complete len:944 (-) Transcript_40681:97-2928(-)|eukprot:CAMPEP_0173383682 /NCGR_PEP_ID=MMETSP1356-20130122/6258_1 /TAXON_ID=77927 ORGANISM="Hemiselmis virescens, Strain PCC157" /NCGR_SAMPLE_ID=MMETSP1356 /ASSEMBLY_ACC=CAM_ASM_000847 /LENGTH=943 /DNA_ID=CAMNT_0014338685 /DNA_START=73 /DNA_END=2904 /DNA_ORIENTATION=+
MAEKNERIEQWLASVLSPEEDLPADTSASKHTLDDVSFDPPSRLSDAALAELGLVPGSRVRHTVMTGDREDWVLKLEKEFSGNFLMSSVIGPTLALCLVEREGVEARHEAMTNAMMRTSLASTLHTSTPVAAAFTKKGFQVFLLSIVGLTVFMFFFAAFWAPARGEPSLNYPYVRAQTLRFVPLGLRDGTPASLITSPGIGSFGLAVDGLPAEQRFVRDGKLSVDGREMLLTFPSPVSFNGWWFVTSSNASAAKDPVSFELLAQLVCEYGQCPQEEEEVASDDWVRVGASGWVTSGKLSRDVAATSPTSRVPTDREALCFLDNSVHWLGVFNELGLSAGCSISIAFSVVLAVRGNINQAMDFASFAWFLVSSWFLSSGIAIFMNGYVLLGMVRFPVALTTLAFGLVLKTKRMQTYIIEIFLMYGATALCAAICEAVWNGFDVANLNDPAYVYKAQVLFRNIASTLLLYGFSLYAMYKRRLLLFHALQLTKEDRDFYDNLWNQIDMNNDKWDQGLELIERLAREISAREDPEHCRQLGRLRRQHGSLAPGWKNSLKTHVSVRRARSKVASGKTMTDRSAHGPVIVVSEPDDPIPSPPPVSFHPRVSVAHSALSALHQPGDRGSSSVRSRLSGGTSQASGSTFQVSESVALGPVVPSANPFLAVSGVDQQGLAESVMQVGFSVDVQDARTGRDAYGQSRERPEIVMGPKFFRFNSFRGTVDVRRPVKSLDQIYLQASVLSPILRAYLLNLASVSNGLLKFQRKCAPEEPGQEPTEKCKISFESWRNVTAGAEGSSNRGSIFTASDRTGELSAGGVAWAPLKRLARASEKALRLYKGDVSCLIDVCRETLVFETPEDMAACLTAMLDNPDIVVVRMKNRLARDYDSSLTAGFRNVSVNIRIVSETTTYFGVDTHVCEVQLLLLSYAQAKVHARHQRYIQFRDAKGE